MLWACIHLPQLALDVIAYHETKPVVIVEQHQQRRYIRYANAAALQRGIHLHSTLATAYSIDAQLIAKPRNLGLEQQALEQLATLAYRFTPHIKLNPPQQILLNINSSLTLFKGFNGFDQQLLCALREQPFTSYVAYYKSAPGASLLANSILLAAHSSRHFNEPTLLTCPIQCLAIPDTHKQQLQQAGLTRTESIFILPKDTLARRFGNTLLHYREQLQGNRPCSYAEFTVPEHFTRQQDLLSEVTDTQALLFPLKRLCEALEIYLRIRQCSARHLQINILQHQRYQTLDITLSQPNHSAAHFIALLKNRLESTVLKAPALGLALTVTQFSTRQISAPDLFSTSPRHLTNDFGAAQLVDRLSSRLGEHALFGITEHEDYRPENSWKKRPPLPLNVREPSAQNSALTALERPLWLLETPREITPNRLKHLNLLQGPERIVSGWWDQNPIARDYFIAQQADGLQTWIYHDLSQKRWYLQGYMG